ncbi:unnamed protein product, partial [marine sediment metagenome]
IGSKEIRSNSAVVPAFKFDSPNGTYSLFYFGRDMGIY